MSLLHKNLLAPLIIATSAFLLNAPANALDIKQQQVDHCVEGAIKFKVADKTTATKLCSCSVDVRSNMTLGQVWEIESYAQSGKDPSSLPYVKTLQNNLQQCTNGLTLNPPQQPNS